MAPESSERSQPWDSPAPMPEPGPTGATSALGGDVEHDPVGVGTQQVGDDAIGARSGVLHHAVVAGDDHAPMMTRGCRTGGAGCRPSACARGRFRRETAIGGLEVARMGAGATTREGRWSNGRCASGSTSTPGRTSSCAAASTTPRRGRRCSGDHYDFAASDVKVLLDRQATKAKVQRALGDLLAGLEAGDVLVFTNSSHGTYRADASGDESLYDEAMCPYDCETELLVDDELRELFAGLPDGVRLTVISDSCHSGSVTQGAADWRPRTAGASGGSTRRRSGCREHPRRPAHRQAARRRAVPRVGR